MIYGLPSQPSEKLADAGNTNQNVPSDGDRERRAMKRVLKGRRPSASMVVAIVALVTAMTGSAAAVSMISGKQIKNGTITGVKVKDSTLDADKLTRKAIRSLRGNKGPRGRVGAAGPAGAAGAQGPIGPRGADGADGQDGIDGQDGADGRDGIDATVSTEPWHVIDRNTVGAAIAQFTVGPFGRTNEANYAATVAPPHGNGSLHLGVNEGDRIAFGTESEFAGLDLDAISALKFWVFVGLDSDPTPRDMPNLSLEVDPGLTSSSYSTLIYVPQTAPKNSWTEIDALSNDTATEHRVGASGRHHLIARSKFEKRPKFPGFRFDVGTRTVVVDFVRISKRARERGVIGKVREITDLVPADTEVPKFKTLLPIRRVLNIDPHNGGCRLRIWPARLPLGTDIVTVEGETRIGAIVGEHIANCVNAIVPIFDTRRELRKGFRDLSAMFVTGDRFDAIGEEEMNQRNARLCVLFHRGAQLIGKRFAGDEIVWIDAVNSDPAIEEQ